MQSPDYQQNPASSGDPASGRRSGFQRLVLALALGAPALYTLSLILRYGVDVPFLDAWNFIYPLIEKMAGDRLNFADVFAPYAEHQAFFPRLIFYGLARLTHWNVRAELLLNWSLACVEVLNIWRLASLTGALSRRNGYGLLFLSSVLTFTPLKMELWVNSLEVQFSLVTVPLTACLWIAPAVRFPINWLLTIALSFVSTFSLGSGIVCWILTIPVLWLSVRDVPPRRRMAWGFIWLLALSASIFFWQRGYQTPAPGSGLAAVITHPIAALQFVLTFLGSGFALGTQFEYAALAQVAGVLLIAAFAIVAVYLWRFREDKALRAKSLPWLMLGLFALVNAAITALWRMDLGVIQALSSRYLAVSLLLPIALLFLLPAIFAHWRAHATTPLHVTRMSAVLVSVLTAFLLLHALGVLSQHRRPDVKRGRPCPPGCEAWEVVHHDRLTMRALLLLINVIDEPETLKQIMLIDDPLGLKAQINLLNRIRYFRPRLVRTPALREILGVTLRIPRQFGEIQSVERPVNGQLSIAGWAVLPDKRRQADAVVLTYDDPRGEPLMFALAMVQTPRTDLPSSSHQSAWLLRSGWVKTFDVSRLPPGDHLVRAWAFDAESCRAYPLHGNVNVVNDTNGRPQLKK